MGLLESDYEVKIKVGDEDETSKDNTLGEASGTDTQAGTKTADVGEKPEDTLENISNTDARRAQRKRMKEMGSTVFWKELKRRAT